MGARHPLVILNTGNGKGKSTAAFGVVLRAWGRGWNIAVLQFVKSKTNNYGERRAAKKLGIEWHALGDGWTWTSKDIERTGEMAREGWQQALPYLTSGEYDLVVLDELTYTMKYGWITVEEVIEALRTRHERTHVIVTGRNAPPELVEFADLVTEMTEIRHPYKAGIKAQPGIEF
jgi:cob(I)alamin adenosyltransferase